MHPIGNAVLLCLTVQLIVTTPARAAHAYASTCCSVPSSVSVIDRAAHKTISTLVTGEGSAFVALSPDNKTSYIANENEGSISVLDTATGVQTSKISLSSYRASPFGEFIGSDGMLYVVAGQGGSLDVLGVDTSDNSVQFDVQIPGSYSTSISPIPLPSPAMSRDGRHIYIFASQLVVFDVKTFASHTISVPPGNSHPQGVAVTPDEAYALLTFNGDNFNGDAGRFLVVNLKSKTVEKQIEFVKGDTVGSIFTSPDGSLAYFPLNTSGNVSVQVFSFSSQTITGSFPAGSGSGTAIAVSPDGSEIELGESNAEVVSINATTGAVTAQTGTLGYLVSLTFSSDGSLLFVPNYDSAMVQVIDPQTLQITAQIPAGWETSVFDENYTMAVSADGRKIAVTGNLNVTFIDAAKQRVIGAVAFSAPFDCVTFSPHGSTSRNNSDQSIVRSA